MKSLIVTLKMPTIFYTSQANMEKGYHTPTEERPGIIILYANFAQEHVERYEKKGDVQKISREKIERQMLSGIDKAKFPIEYKMSWYHAILVSLSFDAFWKGIAKHLKLPKSCTKRFTPDEDLYEYDAPTDVDEAEEGAEDEMDHEAEDDAEDDVEDEIQSAIHNNANPTTTNFLPVISHTPVLTTNHESQSSSSDSDSDSDWSSRSGTRHKWPKLTEENKLAPHPQRQIPPMCRECGNTARPCWCDQKNDDGENVSDGATERNSQHGGHEMTALANLLDGLHGHCDYPSAASGVVHGLAGNEGEHSAYEEFSLSKNKDRGKAQTTTCSYPRAVPDAMNNRALQEEDDSSYEDTPSNRKAKTKAKPKSKATPTLEGAAKPKGITKAKSAPKKKSQTPAQLKTAAAKTREPALPKTKKAAAKKAAPKISPATPTPMPATNPNDFQTQPVTLPDEAAQKKAAAPTSGLKRMLELHPDDDDDAFPASKRVKVGGVTPAPALAPAPAPVPTDADAAGERKKLPASGQKKVAKWKPIEEEWDGTLRGFGDY